MQTLSNICLTFIRTKLEYACDNLVEHNLQVEILFPLKQCGNICLLGVHIASWQHFTKCILNYVLNIWVLNISDHNLRSDENYATPSSKLLISTTFFISSTILSWKNFDLNIINSLNISCLNLGLNKNTIKSPKYYCEGSRKLKILH